jgi:Neuraminidase (sialidase)
MAQFPVTSTDHGHQWTVAGPLLANDWVGGSLYYVTRVTACSPTVVAMVGIAVVDVTVDGGHAWTQFVTEGSLTGEWDISVAGCARRAQGHPADVVLHVVIATAGPQQGDSATYATDDGGDTWLRQSEHVG